MFTVVNYDNNYQHRFRRLAHVPNILTLLRIAASPVLILLLKNGQYSSALWVCALAGISDALDGYIAKTFRCQSRFGAILDPIADKVLIVSVVVMLAVNGVLPFWLLLVIVFRDLLIVGGWMLLTLLNTEVTIRPSLISKANTVVQILLLLALIVDKAGLLIVPDVAMAALMTVVVITTVLSGIHYVWIWGFTDQSTSYAPHAQASQGAAATATTVARRSHDLAARPDNSRPGWSNGSRLPDPDRS